MNCTVPMKHLPEPPPPDVASRPIFLFNVYSSPAHAICGIPLYAANQYSQTTRFLDIWTFVVTLNCALIFYEADDKWTASVCHSTQWPTMLAITCTVITGLVAIISMQTLQFCKVTPTYLMRITPYIST